MSGLLLLIALGAAGMVIFWYVFDEATRDGEGRSGFLGMSDRARPSQSDDDWRRTSGKRPWRIGRS